MGDLNRKKGKRIKCLNFSEFYSEFYVVHILENVVHITNNYGYTLNFLFFSAAIIFFRLNHSMASSGAITLQIVVSKMPHDLQLGRHPILHTRVGAATLSANKSTT